MNTVNDTEKLHIDEFLAVMADGDLDEAKVKNFEELLLDRSDLQDYYATRLGHQLLLLNQLKYFHPELGCDSGQFYPSISPLIPGLTDDCMPPEYGDRLEPLSLAPARWQPKYDWRYVLGLACSFLLGAVVAIWSSQGRQLASWSTPTPEHPSVPTADPIESAKIGESASPDTKDPAATPPEVTDNGLMVNSRRSLNLVSNITRTESIESMELPCKSDFTGSVYKPCTGTALLHREEGTPERGYLIALEPGQQMDIYIDTTAHDQNALSIVELDERGELAGGWTTFDNLFEKNANLPVRRLGKIGYLSEYNPSDQTKYFLFVGSHMLPGQTIDRRWYQSDFRVRLSSDDLTVVGWDDSGTARYNGPVPVDYQPDYDFNDVMMTVHFTSPESPENPVGAGIVNYLPLPQEEEAFAEKVGLGCKLQVTPGHELILSTACNSSTLNSVQIVELPSKRIIWRKSNEPDESGNQPEGDFGVFAIRNLSDKPVLYEFQSFHRQKAEEGEEPSDWSASPFRVFAGGERHVLFGFEDHPGDPIHHNNEDVNVIGRLLKLE